MIRDWQLEVFKASKVMNVKSTYHMRMIQRFRGKAKLECEFKRWTLSLRPNHAWRHRLTQVDASWATRKNAFAIVKLSGKVAFTLVIPH